MPDPTGLEYTVRENGEVAMSHHSNQATVLRGRKTNKFLADVDGRDPQH